MREKNLGKEERRTNQMNVKKCNFNQDNLMVGFGDNGLIILANKETNEYFKILSVKPYKLRPPKAKRVKIKINKEQDKWKLKKE